MLAESLALFIVPFKPPFMSMVLKMKLPSVPDVVPQYNYVL